MPTRSHGRAILALALALVGCPDATDPGDGGPPILGTGHVDASSTSDAADDSTSTSLATTGDETGPTIDYATQIQPIWEASCTCHLQGPSGTMVAPVLTLNADMSHAQLVGTPSFQSPLVRVQPGSRDDSYLWHKLNGTYIEVGGMGDPMPLVGTLSADALQLIGAWIDAGAPP